MADETVENSNPALKCGIVRPIAEMDGYSAQHWSDVHTIMTETLTSVGFDVRLVSDADEVGVIQGRIVKNLYEADLVVCDVSGKNPNVMLELGMRLAFDKPTIVIKDDITAYSFDTSPIEHIPYPRDLRYNAILEFKDQLARKSKATVKAPSVDGYKSFLQHFGPIQVPVFDKQEVSADSYIINELRDIKNRISRIPVGLPNASQPHRSKGLLNSLMDGTLLTSFKVENISQPTAQLLTSAIGEFQGVDGVNAARDGKGYNFTIIHKDDISSSRKLQISTEAIELVEQFGGQIA